MTSHGSPQRRNSEASLFKSACIEAQKVRYCKREMIGASTGGVELAAEPVVALALFRENGDPAVGVKASSSILS